MLIEDTDFRLSIENIYSFSFIQNILNIKISSEELLQLGIKYKKGNGVEKF
jgi:hypothetical protein